MKGLGEGVCQRPSQLCLLKCVFILTVTAALGNDSRGVDSNGRMLFTEMDSPSRASARIIGGEEALPGEFPYFTSLRYLGNHFCGGILVSPNVVLTAAHCVQGNSQIPPHPSVVMGTVDINPRGTEPCLETFETCTTIVHKRFDINNLLQGYDIALLVLNASSQASPVELPRALELSEGTRTTATGFGRLGNSRGAMTLQKAEALEYISNEDCSDRWNADIGGNLMCVWDPAGSDVCKGDSGGPLLTNDKKTVLGVVSFGPRDCQNVNIPSVFTKISQYVGFIKRIGDGESVRFDKDGCTAEAIPVNTGNGEITAEDIVAAIKSEDVDAAAALIEEAVEQENEEIVLEAVKQAVEEGYRSIAGRAVLLAVNLGVPAPKLLPALNFLSSRG